MGDDNLRADNCYKLFELFSYATSNDCLADSGMAGVQSTAVVC